MNSVDNGDDKESLISWEIRVDDIVLQKGAGRNKKKRKSESKGVWKYQMQVVNKVICSGVAVHAPY